MASIRQKNTAKTWTATVRVPRDILELNPSYIQKRDGSPKTHLERATKTQDKREATRIANAFQLECDRNFQETRARNQGSADDRLSSGVQSILREFDSDPQSIRDWLQSKNIRFLEESGLAKDLAHSQNSIRGVSNLSMDQLKAVSELLIRLAKSPADFQDVIETQKLVERSNAYQTTVAEVFERYVNKRVADGPIKSSTIKRARDTFKQFCFALPYGADTPAKNITVKAVRDWVVDFQLKENGKGNSTQTVKNKIDTIAPAFARAEEEEIIPKNPFRKYTNALLVTKRGVKQVQANRSWINDDLSDGALTRLVVAASKKFSLSHSPNHKYMMPLIGLALFTGARIEELCRLTTGDIKTRPHLKIRYIDISEAKSEAGVREIPLLPVAEQIIDKLIQRLPHGETSLFPDLKPRDGRYSHGPSNEFSRFKKTLGYVQKNEYTFHSFRSTVITLLDRNNVQNDYISMMVGHVEGRNTLAKKTYSAGRQLRQLLDAVKCISYGIELESHLLQSIK